MKPIVPTMPHSLRTVWGTRWVLRDDAMRAIYDDTSPPIVCVEHTHPYTASVVWGCSVCLPQRRYPPCRGAGACNSYPVDAIGSDE